MTAEIAILNRFAVAVAADSAATAGSGDGPSKVFPGANKIFSLGRNSDAISVMVYGSAAHMGIPWETIIKVFRRRLKDTRLPTVEAYADWFANNLLNSPELVLPDTEAEHISGTIGFVFNKIKNTATNMYDDLVQLGKTPTTFAEFRRIVGDIITATQTQMIGGAPLRGVDATKTAEVSEAIKPIVDAAIAEEFPYLDATKGPDAVTIQALEDIALSAFIREQGQSQLPVAGVVFCGFGERQIVPDLFEYQSHGSLRGVQHWIQRRTVSLATGAPQIVPFAQRQEVDSFFTGAHPEFDMQVLRMLDALKGQLVPAIASALGPTNTSLVAPVSQAVVTAFTHSQEAAITELREFRQRTFVKPIAQVVAHLPKDELAQMAETLVSLTSFRRRMSWDMETVGGPVDVAVITKGDGLVWVKRKHYFPAELNPKFGSE